MVHFPSLKEEKEGDYYILTIEVLTPPKTLCGIYSPLPV